MERALVFAAYILRHETGVLSAKSIEKRIKRQLALWDNGKIAELVEEIVNVAKKGGGCKQANDNKSIAWTFHSMVIGGRLRAAVRWMTNRSGGGFLNPADADRYSMKKTLSA